MNNLFTNDITDYYMYAYTVINLCIAFLGCFFALYAFQAFTKGRHFREWREFEPLDAPIPKAVTWATVQRYRELRGTAHDLLIKILSLTLNRPEDQVSSEHIVYAVLEHFSPNCVPNSAIDNNDIKFTTEVNKVILQILNTKASELRKFMQETFPNQNF